MNPTRQSHLRSSCLPFPTSLPPFFPRAHPLLRLYALLLQRQCSLTSSADLSLLCAKRQARNKTKQKKKNGPQRCKFFNSSQITSANRTLMTPLFVCSPSRETPDLQEKKKKKHAQGPLCFMFLRFHCQRRAAGALAKRSQRSVIALSRERPEAALGDDESSRFSVFSSKKKIVARTVLGPVAQPVNPPAVFARHPFSGG